MLVVIILMLSIPAIMRWLGTDHWEPLKGASTERSIPKWNTSAWLDGKYQQDFDKYAIQHFGVQPPLVRLANQLDYSLFNQANARYVIVGKNNCLYETPYIEAHLGMDYLGNNLIEDYVRKWSALRDTLGQLGITLDMAFAPGKASYYPEFIPDYYLNYAKDSTNYESFKYFFDKHNVPYLDLNQWFRAMKDTSSHVLVPLTGIHWSKYGMVLTTDSIASYWRQTSSKNVADFEWEVGETTLNLKGSDADVEDGMNLIQALPKYPINYPNYRFIPSDTVKIRTAVIGDSYYWGLFDVGLTSHACDSSQFWYYFRQVYPESFKENLPMDSLNLQEAIEAQDRIMLLQTDGTLDRFGFGFVEKAYSVYFEESTK